LEWIKALDRQEFFAGEINFDNLDSRRREVFLLSLPVLAKSNEDLTSLRKKYS
jgi:hypothetical protein